MKVCRGKEKLLRKQQSIADDGADVLSATTKQTSAAALANSEHVIASPSLSPILLNLLCTVAKVAAPAPTPVLKAAVAADVSLVTSAVHTHTDRQTSR